MFRPIAILLTGLISEVLLWGSLIIIALGVTAYLFEWYKLPIPGTGGQTIKLVFDDVSQLGVGSPVNWMGVSVGYVSSIKPVRDRVEVTAEIEREVGYIPKGSHFTVEFNGLAGGKSLEIQPNEKGRRNKHTKDINGFEVEEPIRLGDVFKTQVLIADGVAASMENIKNSIDNTGAERIEQRVDKENKRMARYVNEMGQASNSIQAFTKRLNDGTVETLENIRHLDSEVRQEILPTVQNTQGLKQLLADSARQTQDWSQNLDNMSLPIERLKTLNSSLYKALGGSTDFGDFFNRYANALDPFLNKISFPNDPGSTPSPQGSLVSKNTEQPSANVNRFMKRLKDSLEQFSQQTNDLTKW